ncbi:MAG: hypothetical protein KKA54_20460 [Proteobacteria bacterium]|nr:hypothetical protein [Pseudomonadota bacterium]
MIQFQQIIAAIQPIDLSAGITAIATLVLAILTFVYVRLTGKILTSQSDPCVILTVVHDENRPTILQLVARNVGSGVAHDIKFEFSRSLPKRAFGLTIENAKEVQKMVDGPLINGIPALGPGECRKLDWGQYGGLMGAIGKEPIVATCKFKKNGKYMQPMQCPLEVASFIGTVANESPSAKVASELEKIAKSIQNCASGFHKLKVEVVSLPEDETKKEDA